ncbi:hypothetical protein [Salinithrix halophila]|uniref:TrbC/VIRB2 family protein n=1 Tax=Salinithrix halophila TaxID=1485204 RepID=A0ABV8J9L0_9BACL
MELLTGLKGFATTMYVKAYPAMVTLAKKKEKVEPPDDSKMQDLLKGIGEGLDQVAFWATIVAPAALGLVASVIGFLMIINNDHQSRANLMGWLKRAVGGAILLVIGPWFMTWVWDLLVAAADLDVTSGK